MSEQDEVITANVGQESDFTDDEVIYFPDPERVTHEQTVAVLEALNQWAAANPPKPESMSQDKSWAELFRDNPAAWAFVMIIGLCVFMGGMFVMNAIVLLLAPSADLGIRLVSILLATVAGAFPGYQMISWAMHERAKGEKDVGC